MFFPTGVEISLSGIILAGGSSTRFGQDKGLARFGGLTLIERAAGVLAPFCREIIISSGNPGHWRFGYRVVPDHTEGSGPMMGIFSALQASHSSMNLVLAVDNIFVGSDFFTYLLKSGYRQYDAAVPVLEGRYFEPLVGLYSTNILPAMSGMIRDCNFRLPDLLRKSKVLTLEVERDFPGYRSGYFRSANSPEDLAT